MIQENVVINVVVWNGDTSQWNPPNNVIMLSQETTPSQVWKLNETKTEYELKDTVGEAAIGFSYDGHFCITNLEKPEPPSHGELAVTIVK